MTTKTKITRDEVATALGLDLTGDPSKLTLSAGTFTLRKEYFWRPKTTEEASFLPNVERLTNAGFEVTVIEYGDHFASFKGGESVKKNSHRWMKFKVSHK